MTAAIGSAGRDQRRKVSSEIPEVADDRRSVVPRRSSFAVKLSNERHRFFVGRESESKEFESALEALSCSLLFVHGQTGVGRTSLLRAYQRACDELGHPVLFTEATDLVRRADDGTLSRVLPPGFEEGAGERPRPVLLVDGYELLSSYDPSLLDRIGSALPEDVLLVVASRNQAPLRLSLDRAWVGLTRQLELRPWSDDQAAQFLDLHEVPAAARRTLLDATGGYPLALTLAVDVLRGEHAQSFELAQVQAMQVQLARVLTLHAPTPVQQLALDVCALAQVTSFELLEHVLKSNGLDGSTNSHELFEWLAARTYVERIGTGLRPHLLARLSLIARVRRDQKYQAVFRPVREFCVDKLAAGSSSESGLGELFFLDRDVPFVRERQLSTTSEQSSFVVAAVARHEELIDLIRRHEGEESAELCRARLAVEPNAFEIPRQGPIDRMLHAVTLSSVDDLTLAESDPAARLARQYVQQHPLAPGSSALFFRWFMDDDAYQTPGPSVLSVVARLAQIVMAAQAAYSLCVYRDPEEWTEMWDVAVSPRELVGRFELGRERYSVLAFSYVERSLRDRLVDAWKVPDAPTTPSANAASGDQRGKIKERAAELARSAKLTVREAEILELLSLGSSFEEIAAQLRIRPRTVKFHHENLLRKAGVATRIELFRRLI